MAQALLNNLTNNTQLMQDFKKDLQETSADIDFQKVLDKKVENIEQTNTECETTQTAQEIITDKSAQEETTVTQTSMTETEKKDLSDLNEEIKEVLDTIGLTEVEEVSEDVEITVDDTSATEESVDLNNQITNELIIQAALQATTVKPEVEIQENSVQINEEEELNITINGKSLDTVLEDFELSNNIETKVANIEVDSNEVQQKTVEDLVDEEVLNELKIESVETETSDTGSESPDLMQQQTAEEQGVKAMLQANIDYAEVQTNEIKSVTPTQNVKPASATEVTQSKIIEQITKQMEGLHNGSKVNIVLNPESLGKINIQLVNTRDGLSAQLTVATQEARNLLMQGLDGLKDTLLSHGVSVDNVSVKLSESQEAEYNADWTEQEGSEGGYKEQSFNKNQKEKQDFEELMSQDEEN